MALSETSRITLTRWREDAAQSLNRANASRKTLKGELGRVEADIELLQKQLAELDRDLGS
jgi:hypothetical protein